MKEKSQKLLFGRKNYTFLLIGLAFISMGFILMTGGGSDNPEVFNEELYNFRRIRLAPTLIIIGFLFEVAAILAKQKDSNDPD